MPSVSKSQQRLMGMAYAVKSGDMEISDIDPAYRDKVKSLSDGMTKKDLKKYASTKHDDLPETVDETIEGGRISPVNMGGMGPVLLPSDGAVGSGDVPAVADIDDDEEEAKKDKTKKKLEMEGFKLFTQFNNFVSESLVNEAFNFGQKRQYSIDDVNEFYGFWGTLETAGFKVKEIEAAWHSAFIWLCETYKFSDAGALYYLNAKAGRWVADQVVEQKGNIDVVDVLKDYATSAQWKKWSKEYNEFAQKEMMTETFVNDKLDESTLKISGPAYDWWNDRDVQKKLNNIKIRIVGDIGGVLTIAGSDEELQKVKSLFGLNESVVTEAMFSVNDLKKPGLIWWYNKKGDKAQVTKIDKIDNLNFPRAKDAPKDFDISWGMGTLDDWIEKTGEKNPKVGEVYDITESVVTEAVSRATKIYQIATPAPKAMLVRELEDLFGDDYRHIVTEFDEDEGYESVLVFNLTPRDIKRIQEEIGDVLIWEYSIKKGKEISESVVTEAKDNLYLQLHKKYAEQIKGLKAGKIKKLTDLVSVQRWSMEDREDYFEMDSKKKKELSAEYDEERKLFKKYIAGDESVMLPKGTETLAESLVTEASKDRMIKQIERALKDGTSIFKLPMDTQKYYYKNKSDFESVVTESVFAFKPDNIEQLHFETDPKTAEEMKIELGKKQGEVSKRNQIESAEYSLRRFRKEIGYGNGKDVGVFLPGSYDASVSKLGDGPHKKAVNTVKWNRKKYDQWVEDMASNDGWKNAFDMAQNAKNEPGLLQWAKKEFRGEDVMQRIQWDIEAYTESVEPITEKKEDRDDMMKWIEKSMDFVRTTEDFNGNEGGIWLSGENMDEYKGQVIYDYYSEDYKNREFGVLNKWEKELNKRGWYSEWYDAGTVMVWPL